MRGFVGFGLIGGVINHQQIFKIIGESAALRARPSGCAMPVRMRERYDVVDVDIGRPCEFPAGIGADPQAAFHRAASGIFEFHGHFTGCDEQFMTCVLTVSVSINPVRPVFALVGDGR